MQGGSNVAYHRQRKELAAAADIAIVLCGGNDLSCSTPERVAADIKEFVSELNQMGVPVILMGFWRREDEQYNTNVDTLNQILYNLFPVSEATMRKVRFWPWDRRLPQNTFDGVHLCNSGYYKAARYLSSAILWAIRHML